MKNLSDNLPALGVRRPVLITVFNLLIVIAGIAAMLGVDVRELPDVERPIVSVRASYQGASPETMDTEVTSVLEGAVATVAGVVNIEASSEENSGRLRIEFDPSVDLNVAANDVREAVSRVQRRLPEDVDNIFVIKADNNAQAVVTIAATSNTLPKEALAKRIEKDIVPNLLTLTGVAEVRLSGNQQRVLRVLLDPARLAAHRVSVSEVISTLRGARLDVPVGSYESKDTELIVRAYGSVLEPGPIEELYVRDKIRIRDLGVAFFGPDDSPSYSMLNGREVISLEVVRQAGSNTITIAEAVVKRVEEINRRARDLDLYVVSDSSIFIKGALQEVAVSLFLAILIVLVVIALFLGQFQATLIPAVTIPISIIGTVAVIWMLGYSINLLTLLGLVLATGLVVDDAIVVLENIQRHRGMGVRRMAAAVLGSNQVFFAVIATTATLVAVLLPMAFLPSQVGQMFKEFAVVLAVSVSISSIVALTLCPMMASKLPDLSGKNPLLVRQQEAAARFAAGFQRVYFATLRWCCFRRPGLAILISLLLAGGGVWGFLTFDREILPQEDRGVIRIIATGPDGASLSYSDRQSLKLEEVLLPYQEIGLIKDLSTIVGSWDPNRTQAIAVLSDWDRRSVSQMQLVDEINPQLQQIPGAQIRIRTQNSINMRGGGSGGLEVALTGNNYDEILKAANSFAAAVSERLPFVNSALVRFDTSQSQLSFDIDRRRANDLGVDLSDISNTLRVMVDRYDVIDLSIDDEAVPIMVGSLTGTINDPGDLLNVFIPNQDRELIPLSALVHVSESGVSAQLDRHDQRRAISVDIGVKPGTPLGEAVSEIERLAEEILPSDVHLLLLGDAATLNETSHDVAVTFAIALLVVFLVLAAQFESFISALIIIFTVPFGLAAAVFALLLSGQSLNLFSQIGLVMLVGLMTKNAILLVEFMDQLRDQGRPIQAAIMEGVAVRLRPLAMTVLSTVFGALPLILSSGPGSESRSAIGWVIFGGLGLSTLFTLYLTPLGYALLAPLTSARGDAGRVLSEEMDEAKELNIDSEDELKVGFGQ